MPDTRHLSRANVAPTLRGGERGRLWRPLPVTECRGYFKVYNADGEVTSSGDNFSDYAFGYNGQGDVTRVDNAGTPSAPHVVLNSVFDAQGNRTSLAATINGTADFIDSYSYDALSRLGRKTGQNDLVWMRRQSWPESVAIHA